MSIASHADRFGENAWPSVKSLSIEAHLSRRQVQYCLRELCASGELRIDGQSSSGTNRFALPHVLEWLARQAQDGGANIAQGGAQSTTGGGALDCTGGAHPIAPEPSLNRTKQPSNTSALRFVLPEWVPKEEWDGFLEMRKKKDAPDTQRAMKLLVTELTKLRDAGHDPATVLDRSTTRGWTGLFDLNKPHNGGRHGKLSGQELFDHNLRVAGFIPKSDS